MPLLLVTVTVTGLGGVAPRKIDTPSCRSRPMVALLIVMFGAVTVAVIDWRLPGVWKPAGVVTLIVVVPAVAGSNGGAEIHRVAGVEHRGTADDRADVGIGARHRNVHRQPAPQRLRLLVVQRRRIEQGGVDAERRVRRRTCWW